MNKVAQVTICFWIKKICTTTLGETAGDLLSMTMNVGYALSALFWVAFVLTRPFGATFGDLLTKPVAKGGPNFRTVWSSVFLAVILVALVVYATRKEKAAATLR